MERSNSSESIEIRAGALMLHGDLQIPARCRGTVLFAHGSGSSRHSPRNRFVARTFNEAGLATLLFDLLSEEEEAEERAGALKRFDVPLLAERLTAATQWLLRDARTRELPIGYFGASTGAAAALRAAARLPPGVAAVVSRGGRPDLVAPEVLARMETPTLLIVGGLDSEVLALNRKALRWLGSPQKRLEVVAGASHLFEEPGALEQVAALSRDWFLHCFSPQELAAPYARDAEEPEPDAGSDRKPTAAADPASNGEEPGGVFADRSAAGASLARALEHYRDARPLVLAIPRGGVPVAFEVARYLGTDLDVVVARKLGAPGREELAIGAVTADGTRVLNQEIADALGVSEAYLSRITERQRAEAQRRERVFREGRRPIPVTGRTVIVVDDGLATGATMRAVVQSMRRSNVQKLVIAVPVGAESTCSTLEREVDEMVCLRRPEPFYAVGLHYRAFDQTTDEEVVQLLRSARARASSSTFAAESSR